MPNNPLSKNITSRDEATNDLEKLVANMTGANIPEEQTSGLGKELKKILPGAGGLLPEYSNPEVGKILGVEMGQSDIVLFDCHIPNRDVRLSSEQGANTYVGSYPGFKAINDEIIGCYIIIGNTVIPTECYYTDRGGEIFIGYEDNDIQYRFFSHGKYTIINYGKEDCTIHPSRISVTAYVSVPTVIWRDESELPIPSPSVAGKALLVNNQGTGYTLGDWPNELPTPTAQDEGKLIGVNSSGDYILIDDRLPESAAQDEGKLVGVDSSGDYILRNNYTPDPQTVTIGLVEHEATVHNILVGTAELEDGVSDLPTGVIYLQIEE